MFQIETISAKMLDYYVERSDAVIIDLRDPAAYRRGHVRNAANIPYRELEEYLEKKQDQKYRFPKDKLLILYCDRGGASMRGCPEPGKTGLPYQICDRWICRLQREKSCARIKQQILYFKVNHDNVKNRDKNQHKLQGEKIMKYMFASDVHGSAYYCRKMLEAYDAEKAERLVLLGDLLYHGPRNDLPKEYAPKEVIRLLNERKNRSTQYAETVRQRWIRWSWTSRLWQITVSLPSREKRCMPHTVTSIIRIIFRR